MHLQWRQVVAQSLGGLAPGDLFPFLPAAAALHGGTGWGLSVSLVRSCAKGRKKMKNTDRTFNAIAQYNETNFLPKKASKSMNRLLSRTLDKKHVVREKSLQTAPDNIAISNGRKFRLPLKTAACNKTRWTWLQRGCYCCKTYVINHRRCTASRLK